MLISHFQAPTIFIPADSSQPDTVVAIADLGKIRITSDYTKTLSDMDAEHPRESEFYDKIRFSVSGIRVLATTENDQGWQDPDDDNYATYDFVHTDVNLLMEKSINPHDTAFTQMK
jgi:Repeating coiled region of VPS13